MEHIGATPGQGGTRTPHKHVRASCPGEEKPAGDSGTAQSSLLDQPRLLSVESTPPRGLPLPDLLLPLLTGSPEPPPAESPSQSAPEDPPSDTSVSPQSVPIAMGVWTRGSSGGGPPPSAGPCRVYVKTACCFQ